MIRYPFLYAIGSLTLYPKYEHKFSSYDEIKKLSNHELVDRILFNEIQIFYQVVAFLLIIATEIIAIIKIVNDDIYGYILLILWAIVMMLGYRYYYNTDYAHGDGLKFTN